MTDLWDMMYEILIFSIGVGIGIIVANFARNSDPDDK